ncbi:hypothetical protein ACWEJP_28305 [Streptomyces sp. NPDC004749]
MTNAKIGVALVGGYALGRTKKAKLAIGLGMFLAGRKLSVDPRQLGRLVADSPFLSSLNDQARRELVDATKSAATSALTRRVSGLADSLHERTLDLGEPGRRLRRATGGEDEDAEGAEDAENSEEPAEDSDGAADRSKAEAEETDAEETDAEETDAGAEAEPRRERGAKASSRSASKRSTAKAAPAKAASKPRSASRKSGTAKAASGTGKATSGARKATSGARRTTRQGGGHG